MLSKWRCWAVFFEASTLACEKRGMNGMNGMNGI